MKFQKDLNLKAIKQIWKKFNVFFKIFSHIANFKNDCNILDKIFIFIFLVHSFRLFSIIWKRFFFFKHCTKNLLSHKFNATLISYAIATGVFVWDFMWIYLQFLRVLENALLWSRMMLICRWWWVKWMEWKIIIWNDIFHILYNFS